VANDEKYPSQITLRLNSGLRAKRALDIEANVPFDVLAEGLISENSRGDGI
jgi:hypothetical protein